MSSTTNQSETLPHRILRPLFISSERLNADQAETISTIEANCLSKIIKLADSRKLLFPRFDFTKQRVV